MHIIILLTRTLCRKNQKPNCMRFQRKIFIELKYTFCFVVSEPANCNNIKCKDRQVCLNDLITHRPRCVSCSFKCPRRQRPQVILILSRRSWRFVYFNQFFFIATHSDKIHIPSIQGGQVPPSNFSIIIK